MKKESEIQIFYAEVGCLGEILNQPAKWDFLCADRKIKIGAHRRENDKLRALGAGLLLEYGLRRVGLEQGKLRFSHKSNGKPELETGTGEQTRLHFNLSHSGNYAAAVFSDRPVGIDIEVLRTGRQKIAGRFFSEQEKQYLNEHWDDGSFTKIWTRKESYLKATGEGLSAALCSFSVLDDKVGEYEMRSYELPEKVWLTVCTKGSIPDAAVTKIDLKAYF